MELYILKEAMLLSQQPNFLKKMPSVFYDYLIKDAIIAFGQYILEIGKLLGQFF